jgi:hypothetical protein
MAIAKGKYKMDVDHLENYMPKGAAFQEKLKQLAVNLIQKSQAEKKQIRYQIKSKSLVVDDTKKNLATLVDKRDLIRIRLKQKAKEA